MKKIVIGSVLVLLIIGGYGLYILGSSPTREFYHEDYSSLKNSELMEVGWIPPILPESAHSIHVMTQPEWQRTWFCFEYRDRDERTFRESLESADTETFNEYRHDVPARQSWWPDELYLDEENTMTGDGFVFYKYRYVEHEERTQMYLFAVHPGKDQSCGWIPYELANI